MSRKGLNIYKRKDGRWEARYIKSRNALGKPKYGYLYASSYREVRCDLQHTLQLQGKPSGSEERTRNSTFELVSMEWLDAFSINFKESTYIRYRTLIECYLMPSFQTVKIEKITKEMVRKLCKHLELHGKKDKTGLSPKTISDVLSVLRRILNYAGTLGIFVDSKVLDIRVKQTQKSLPILSLPEQMILQQYLEEHPDALNLGILLCLLTGIRIGELCALTWEKISISERNIYICQTMQRIQNRVPGSKKTHIEIASPKSSSANRNYDNAILQYIDIIQHDPTNKEAYAGLYAAYAAQGKADEANKVFEQAQEVFDDEADFLPGFLDDAKLVFESGGGNVPFQMLSEHFWDDLNSVFAKDVGEAWIAADPQNADPYALLGAHYAALDDESGIEKLLQNAETNGVDFNTIDAKIKTNSDGTCTLTVQINDFLKDESGQSASVSVKVDAKDNAKTVTQKVAEKAADSAASKVVEKSGLTGEAAGIANSMAQEALRKGLGSAGSGQGTESSGTVTAPTYDPSQDSGESDDFDWSQIQSEFDSLKDEFPS